MFSRIFTWWWHIRRTRSSQHGILRIFRMPYGQTLVVASPCKSTYVHTVLSMWLTCAFQTYDSLRPSTPAVLHLISNSWDCDVIVSYNCNFRLPAHSLYVGTWRSEEHQAKRSTSFQYSSSDHLMLSVCEKLLRCSFHLALSLVIWSLVVFQFQVKPLCFSLVSFRDILVYFVWTGFISDCLCILSLFSSALFVDKNRPHPVDVGLVFSLPTAPQTCGPIYNFLLMTSQVTWII